MNTRTQLIAAIVLGQAVGLLGSVDLLFFPLVLAGPLVVGGIAAARGLGLLPVVVLWVSAGLNMTVLDWVLLNEDVVFHLVLTVVMSLLTIAGYGVVRGLTRWRSRSSAVAATR